jgi:hypothetical protein
MPRRPRKVKEPAAPVVYSESADISEIAHRLIRLYPMRFGWTTNFQLGYVMVQGARPKPDAERDYMGKFRKVPPLYHGLVGFDAVIEIKEIYWRELDAVEREALVAHELCHGEMSDRGALRVVKHDLTEFHWVVRQYGAWQPDIRTFDEQLGLFDSSGQPTRATLGEQQKLTPVEEAVGKLTDIVVPIVEAALDGQEPVENFRKPETPANPRKLRSVPPTDAAPPTH